MPFSRTADLELVVHYSYATGLAVIVKQDRRTTCFRPLTHANGWTVFSSDYPTFEPGVRRFYVRGWDREADRNRFSVPKEYADTLRALVDLVNGHKQGGFIRVRYL